MPDDLRQGYLPGRTAEPIPPLNPSSTFENPGGLQVIEDLFQKSLGDVLLFGDGLDANNAVAVVEAENHQRPQDILTPNS